GLPAKAGTHLSAPVQAEVWVPAFAGTRTSYLYIRLLSDHRREQALDRGLGIGGAHDLAHDRDAARPGGEALRSVARRDAAERNDRARSNGRRGGERVEAECRAVARLAVGQEDRAQRHVVGAGAELRGGFLSGMRRHADQRLRQSPARRRRIAAARQMYAGGTGHINRIYILMRHDRRAVAAAKHNELSQQRAALFLRQLLLAQAEPAAAAAKRGVSNPEQR